MLQCPYCPKYAASWAGLRTHLAGQTSNGGHAVPLPDAELMAKAAQPVEAAAPSLASPPTSDVVLEALNGIPGDDAAAYLRLLLAQLVADKKLPKYQFERRIDALLSPFVPRLVEHFLGGGTATTVVPEFPLKKEGSNQSTNADQLLVLRERPELPDAWVLFELKTDAGSFDIPQAQIYADARRDGWPRLRSDLAVIYQATKAKAQYKTLIDRVDKAAGDRSPDQVHVLYLTPALALPALAETFPFTFVTFDQLRRVEMPIFPPVWHALKTVVLPALT